MKLNELIDDYQLKQRQTPQTVNDLLDFYQKKYINGEIDIASYREIFSLLHVKGAISAHDHALPR